MAERERLEEELRNLSTAIGEAKAGRQAIFARFAAVHHALQAKEAEEAGLSGELEGLADHGWTTEQLRQGLEDSDELWRSRMARETRSASSPTNRFHSYNAPAW